MFLLKHEFFLSLISDPARFLFLILECSSLLPQQQTCSWLFLGRDLSFSRGAVRDVAQSSLVPICNRSNCLRQGRFICPDDGSIWFVCHGNRSITPLWNSLHLYQPKRHRISEGSSNHSNRCDKLKISLNAYFQVWRSRAGLFGLILFVRLLHIPSASFKS